MGGLVFVGRARLRGVPFMSGFYSKDLFLELARNTRILGVREIIFCYSACALTCGYSLRAAWALMVSPLVLWVLRVSGGWAGEVLLRDLKLTVMPFGVKALSLAILPAGVAVFKLGEARGLRTVSWGSNFEGGDLVSSLHWGCEAGFPEGDADIQRRPYKLMSAVSPRQWGKIFLPGFVLAYRARPVLWVFLFFRGVKLRGSHLTTSNGDGLSWVRASLRADVFLGCHGYHKLVFGYSVHRQGCRGFSVDNSTLTRFFGLHFLLPFVVRGVVILHLFFLHVRGSGNPLGVNSNFNKVRFHLFFTLKDLFGFLVMLGGLSKLGGVVALAGSVLVLFALPLFPRADFRGLAFYPANKLLFASFLGVFALLTWLGMRPVEEPFIFTGQGILAFYVLFELRLVPTGALILG
eukprot:maker-scaffold1053_size66761-snap-gene-0.13 protein:Tk08251 transcript:maker-scaffold1053_size66761-snap-gene-0.13-mRNA-1 annotation:"cytochrome b"